MNPLQGVLLHASKHAVKYKTRQLSRVTIDFAASGLFVIFNDLML